MAQLQRYDNDGLELFIDADGAVFASISGYARMSGKSVDTIAKRVKRGSKGLDKDMVKTAEIQTAGGLQGVDLIPESSIQKWIVRDNPELAEKMLAAGVRVFLYGSVGYKVEAIAPAVPQTYIEALRALADAEEEKERQRIELELADEDINQLSTAVDELFGYSSIIRVAKFNGVSEKSFNWRKLKVQTLALGLEVKRVPCPRFEYKLLYPHQAWEIAYPDIALPETSHWNLDGYGDRPQLP